MTCRQATTVRTMLSAYADNWAWAVKDVLDLQPILEVTLQWTRLVGLQLIGLRLGGGRLITIGLSPLRMCLQGCNSLGLTELTLLLT